MGLCKIGAAAPFGGWAGWIFQASDLNDLAGLTAIALLRLVVIFNIRNANVVA